jgi:ubiquinone/menaquinone biosynthesis C-methylase UbiE
MTKQVNKDAYRFEKYTGLDRWSSYHYQLREILARNPSSVLEVGVGDGTIARHLKTQTPVAYTSVDFADDLKPDVVGDVRQLPFEGASFDLVCAFEVLEHLPFEDFEKALAELVRVARTHVIVSLPHFGPPVKFLLKLPFLPELRFAFKIPYPKAHTFNGQHYWEIGKKGYPPGRIRAAFLRHGRLVKEFVPFENQYHHFFVLEKSL